MTAAAREEELWQRHSTTCLPWIRIHRADQTSDLLPLLQRVDDEFGSSLRVVLTTREVFLTLKLQPHPNFETPALFLHVDIIIARRTREGRGTYALEQQLIPLAERQGWGLVINAPFSHHSASWLQTRVCMRRLPSWCWRSGFVFESKTITLTLAPLEPLTSSLKPLTSSFSHPPMASSPVPTKKAKFTLQGTPTSVFSIHRDIVRAALRDAPVYPHQRRACDNIVEFFRGGPRAGYMQMPTGSGKTGVAVLACYTLGVSRVLIITPSLIISKQVSAAFMGQLQTKQQLPKDPFLVERVMEIKPLERHRIIPEVGLAKKSAQIRGMFSRPVLVANAHKISQRASIEIQELPKDYDLVIIDEAHHYPADTWSYIIDAFPHSYRLFLTATADRLHNTPVERIAPDISIAEMVRAGVIREMDEFDEVKEGHDDIAVFAAMTRRIRARLDEHDRQDSRHIHQAMVLVTNNTRPAVSFQEIYNGTESPLQTREPCRDRCEIYVENSPLSILEDFIAQKFRTLVIIGRLLEGFDHKYISVVAIARNVQPSSRVLFTQFVGRAVRKIHEHDPVKAVVISHAKFFHQRSNFDNLFRQAEEECVDEEDWE